jgi:hypothetical protein
MRKLPSCPARWPEKPKDRHAGDDRRFLARRRILVERRTAGIAETGRADSGPLAGAVGELDRLRSDAAIVVDLLHRRLVLMPLEVVLLEGGYRPLRSEADKRHLPDRRRGFLWAKDCVEDAERGKGSLDVEPQQVVPCRNPGEGLWKGFAAIPWLQSLPVDFVRRRTTY